MGARGTCQDLGGLQQIGKKVEASFPSVIGARSSDSPRPWPTHALQYLPAPRAVGKLSALLSPIYALVFVTLEFLRRLQNPTVQFLGDVINMPPQTY